MRPHERFEQEWGTFAARPNVVACSSGTAALHLALESLKVRLGWPNGAEVLVPDFTMVACPRAVVMAGLTPVFVDCGPDLLMDCSLLRSMSIDAHVYPEAGWHDMRKVVAVMPVHIYGRRCDMDAVYNLSRSHGLAVIEDCAEFHGGRTGELSDAWCWSFYRNKVVAGDEGGAVAFREGADARLARQLRSHGFTDAHDFNHVPRGWNHRMPDCCAEPVFSSMLHYPDRVIDDVFFPGTLRQRHEIVGWYDAACPDEWRMPPREVPWVYDLRLRSKKTKQRDDVVKALQAAGIEARHGFKPMSEQAEFCHHRLVRHEGLWHPGKCNEFLCLPEKNPKHFTDESRATEFGSETLYLPIQPGVTTEAGCRRAFETIRRAFETIRRVVGE